MLTVIDVGVGRAADSLTDLIRAIERAQEDKERDQTRRIAEADAPFGSLLTEEQKRAATYLERWLSDDPARARLELMGLKEVLIAIRPSQPKPGVAYSIQDQGLIRETREGHRVIGPKQLVYECGYHRQDCFDLIEEIERETDKLKDALL